MSKKLSELPITTQFAEDGTVIISSASAGTYRMTLEKFIELIGGGSGGDKSLSELTDVNISALQNGQILQYNATNHKWENVNENNDSWKDMAIESRRNLFYPYFYRNNNKYNYYANYIDQNINGLTCTITDDNGIKITGRMTSRSPIILPLTDGLLSPEGDEAFTIYSGLTISTNGLYGLFYLSSQGAPVLIEETPYTITSSIQGQWDLAIFISEQAYEQDINFTLYPMVLNADETNTNYIPANILSPLEASTRIDILTNQIKENIFSNIVFKEEYNKNRIFFDDASIFTGREGLIASITGNDTLCFTGTVTSGITEDIIFTSKDITINSKDGQPHDYVLRASIYGILEGGTVIPSQKCQLILHWTDGNGDHTQTVISTQEATINIGYEGHGYCEIVISKDLAGQTIDYLYVTPNLRLSTDTSSYAPYCMSLMEISTAVADYLDKLKNGKFVLNP